MGPSKISPYIRKYLTSVDVTTVNLTSASGIYCMWCVHMSIKLKPGTFWGQILLEIAFRVDFEIWHNKLA